MCAVLLDREHQVYNDGGQRQTSAAINTLTAVESINQDHVCTYTLIFKNLFVCYNLI